ncbi:MAG TPA: glycine--tRNA ligase subunit beta [Caldimonas sp.]|jgi:glycyl-tRNA synthetase beta chain|nr:glycine--tRNA ligase subunit beta [Caldimonas sp.]HEV7578129.1 glycine--tRNA ligase subunit beta [Caldimonas sp.]
MATSPPRPLLVELFVEELPPKALPKLAAAFAEAIAAGLHAEALLDANASVTPYATPRRLAVFIDAVAGHAADRAVSQKLMPVSIGLTASGEATPALAKKLAALGADASVLPQLQRRMDGKSETLFLNTVAAGATLAEGLQRALDRALAQLPIPKVMQYQLDDGWTSVSFVRPAHGLVALHGDDVVPVRALGLDAGRTTHGHRFEGSRAPITLRQATSYAAQLRDEGAVIASFAERRAEIRRQLDAAAAAAELAPVDDDALLDEVTALVELPNVLTCRFDREFLTVPPECLVLTMKANQKYFPLLERDGRLTDRFLVVSNIAPADPARIVEGNERVVRPRLADAKFFYDQDRRRTLASRVPGLDKVVYHGKLGSQGDRVRRLRRIASWVAGRIGADVARADRAALLAKADLLTDMVGEFPELQGIMGGYYAAHDGEAADVAAAIRDQYVNRRGDVDAKAINLVGEALLIADRAEALVGIWGIGLKPTGDKDPYALRRHALTLIDSFQRVAGGARSHRLALRELLEEVASTFAVALAPDVVAEVESFVYERYFQQLAAVHDTRAVDAVIGLRPALHDVVGRLLAVREFLALPEAPALAAANKRVGNILKKSDAAPASLDPALLAEPAEHALAAALADIGARADQASAAGEYARSLRLLAGLKPAVDAFFDTVMVNVESPALRANRLALLAALRTTMNRVADLARLAA